MRSPINNSSITTKTPSSITLLIRIFIICALISILYYFSTVSNEIITSPTSSSSSPQNKQQVYEAFPLTESPDDHFRYSQNRLSSETNKKKIKTPLYRNVTLRIPPTDARILAEPAAQLFKNSNPGGAGTLLPRNKIWLVVKRRESWLWWNWMYPLIHHFDERENEKLCQNRSSQQAEVVADVKEFATRRPSSKDSFVNEKPKYFIFDENEDDPNFVFYSWSCGIGQVNVQRSQQQQNANFQVKLWNKLPLMFPSRPNDIYKNISYKMGWGWAQKYIPEVRHFTASSNQVPFPCETNNKIFLAAEIKQHFLRMKALQQETLTRLKKVPSMLYRFQKEMAAEGKKIDPKYVYSSPTGNYSQFEVFLITKHKHIFPTLTPPLSPGSHPPVTKNDLKTNSVSVNQLMSGCLDDIIAIDGRAPSFAHAMSRRCVDPFALANKKLFFLGIGHSHTRYLFGMMCMLGNHKWCEEFSSYHFHVPIYPVNPYRWFDKQELLQWNKRDHRKKHKPEQQHQKQRQEEESEKKSSSSSNEQQQKQQQHHNNGAHFKLFYSASWYDPRVAFIRSLQYLIDEHKVMEERLLNGQQDWNIPTTSESTKFPQQKQRKAGENVFEDTEPPFSLPRIDYIKLLPPPPNITQFYEEDFGMEEHKQLHRLWDAQLISWVKAIRPYLAHEPTHFVVSRGEWDMHFMSPKLSAIVEQTANFLDLVHQLFPDAVIIFQLPQRHMHFRNSQQMYRYRGVCASEARVQIMKDINICSAYKAFLKAHERIPHVDRPFEHSVEYHSQNSFMKKLVMFDSDAVANSWLGATFVDAAGHHYMDVALEVLALEIRNIAANKQIEETYIKKSWFGYLKDGKELCDKYLNEAAAPVPNTAFNNTKFIEWFNVSAKHFNHKGAELLYSLPVSPDFGFPALNGTKELICTCHQDVNQKFGFDVFKGINNTIRDELCESIKVSPKDFLSYAKMREDEKQQQQQKNQKNSTTTTNNSSVEKHQQQPTGLLPPVADVEEAEAGQKNEKIDTKEEQE